MVAGQRRSLLAFEEPVKTEDGGGGFEIVWTERFRAYARVEPIRSIRQQAEEIIKGAVSSGNPVRIHIPSSSSSRAATGQWRAIDVRDPTVAYAFHSLSNEDERNYEIVIFANKDRPS